MGRMKRFAEDVSTALGYDGEFNQATMDAGNRLLKKHKCHAVDKSGQEIDLTYDTVDGKAVVVVAGA